MSLTSLLDCVGARATEHGQRQRNGTFLLLDQTGLPNFRSIWPLFKTFGYASCLTSLVNQPDGASPLLLDVSSPNADVAISIALRRTYEQGRFANCVSVIKSRLDLPELALAMKERAFAELTDRVAIVLRFFDTRTLPLLPRLLMSAQYAAFVSCADAWHYLDRQGAIQSLPTAAAEHQGQPFIAPMRFDLRQEKMLIDDSLVDEVIDQLLDMRHPAVSSATPPEQFARVDALVRRARDFGIDDVLPAVRYCCAAFEHGDEFCASNPWSQKLMQFKSGQLALEDALQSV